MCGVTFETWGCTCNKECPVHPKWPSWTTTTTLSPTYVPRHRKPGPAQ